MQSNKIKTYFKIFSGTFSLSLPFCLSSFRFWFRFPFRRMLYCILYIYLSLLCFLHFNIHILDAFFNDLLGLSVNETVFSTSTWFFGRLFFFASFCFGKTFLNEIFLIYVFGIFFYFLFGILAHSCPLYTPLSARCCCLLCPLRRVEFFFCFWQIVSNEFSLDTAGFLAWLPLQLFPLSPPPTSPPHPLAGQFKREF